MQQLSLSRPLSPTRILALPDHPRAARIVPIGTKVAATLTPGISPRKRLALPLRPVQSLSPRPVQPKPVVRGRELPCGAIAFVSAEQAWFWTVAVLAARHGRVLPKRRRPRSLAPTTPEPRDELELAPRHDSMAPLIFRRDPVEYHHVKIPRPCDPTTSSAPSTCCTSATRSPSPTPASCAATTIPGARPTPPIPITPRTPSCGPRRSPGWKSYCAKNPLSRPSYRKTENI